MCVSGGWGAAGVHRSQAVVPEGHPVVYSILFCFLALTQSLTESGGPQASTIPLPPLPPAGGYSGLFPGVLVSPLRFLDITISVEPLRRMLLS